MKVHELVEWLKAFPDQDADVMIVEHSFKFSLYGDACEKEFDPGKHAEYTDMRGNRYVKETAPHYNQRTLLLGAIHA